MALCGAKTRQDAPCGQVAMPNGRCRFHGGRSRAGVASATFVTGRYSKHLPSRLADRYHEALADADLLALRDEVALLDVRLSSLLDDIRAVDGLPDDRFWEDVWPLIDQRRRTVETEQKRLVAMQQMITAEQAMTLLGAVAGIIRTHVDDPRILAAISADLAVLTLAGTPRLAVGASDPAD